MRCPKCGVEMAVASRCEAGFVSGGTWRGACRVGREQCDCPEGQSQPEGRFAQQTLGLKPSEAVQADGPVLILEFACRCRQCAGYGQVQGRLAVPQRIEEEAI